MCYFDPLYKNESSVLYVICMAREIILKGFLFIKYVRCWHMTDKGVDGLSGIVLDQL